jgi:2,3-dihydro-2,3-dihydroxybenzoate dehydrogenase
MKKAENKTVLITGAAGGLGNALVKLLSERGYHIIATDISLERLSGLNSHVNVVTKQVDVTDLEKVGLTIREFDLEETGLDILICLAGIYDSFPVTEADPRLFSRIMDINLLGTVNMVHALLKPLIKKHGRVIVVSSESYKIQAMFQPYMISKAALEAYCRTARQELALKGVKLSVVRPGAIRTPLLNWMKSPGDPAKYPAYKYEYEASHDRSVRMVGSIFPPEKVARKIVTAAMVNHPRRIYRVNNSILLRIISIVPAGLFDWLVIHSFTMKKG